MHSRPDRGLPCKLEAPRLTTMPSTQHCASSLSADLRRTRRKSQSPPSPRPYPHLAPGHRARSKAKTPPRPPPGAHHHPRPTTATAQNPPAVRRRLEARSPTGRRPRTTICTWAPRVGRARSGSGAGARPPRSGRSRPSASSSRRRTGTRSMTRPAPPTSMSTCGATSG